MFTVNLEYHRIQRDELIRQAEAYRIAKLAARPSDLISSIKYALGKLMILSGRQLLSLSAASR